MHISVRHSQILKSIEERAPVTQVWAQQYDDLKMMWQAGTPTEAIAENLGRSVSAVLTQAARLGLARRQAPGRKAKTAETKKKISSNVIAFRHPENLDEQELVAVRHEKRDRNCLMCSTSFNSHGSHNRICPRCKAGSAYRVGHEDSYRVLSA